MGAVPLLDILTRTLHLTTLHTYMDHRDDSRALRAAAADATTVTALTPPSRTPTTPRLRGPTVTSTTRR